MTGDVHDGNFAGFYEKPSTILRLNQPSQPIEDNLVGASGDVPDEEGTSEVQSDDYQIIVWRPNINNNLPEDEEENTPEKIYVDILAVEGY